MRRLGPRANKFESYGVASVSGTILAVCSRGVLPMFAGIYRLGAGLGPASTFLCSGPALNVTAIFLTARVLGFELGVARTVAAVGMSVLVGLATAALFRKSEARRIAATPRTPVPAPSRRKSWQTILLTTTLIAFLVFSDWPNPGTKILTFESGATLTRLDQTAGDATFSLSGPVRLETSITQQTGDELKFQVQNALSGVETLSSELRPFFAPGENFLTATRDVSSVENVVPANYRWSAAVFDVRWAICVFLGVAVLYYRPLDFSAPLPHNLR